MILDKMRSCIWKLVLWFRSSGLIRLLSPSGPNVVSRSQAQKSKFFWDIMILMDSFYDFGRNEVLFVKIGAIVLDLQLDTCFGPNCPKLVLRPQTPNITALRFKNFFISSFIKFFMQQALIFKFYVTFDKVMSVFFLENGKKAHQNSSFWCHSR